MLRKVPARHLGLLLSLDQCLLPILAFYRVLNNNTIAEPLP